MILLFTDYGAADLYVGQIHAVICLHAPGVDVIDLLHTAPNFNIRASAHLLAALAPSFQLGSVCLAVIDPGVGSTRDAVVMLADEKWYVGPDNGLLSVVAARAEKLEVWRISWKPENLSHTFHGRDLFAPIAAWIEKGEFPYGKLVDTVSLQVQLDAGDLAEIVYIDHYGNALTGLRTDRISSSAASLCIGTTKLAYAPIFAEVAPDKPFWHGNSIGLVEIAVNSGNAAQMLALKVGDPVHVLA